MENAPLPAAPQSAARGESFQVDYTTLHPNQLGPDGGTQRTGKANKEYHHKMPLSSSHSLFPSCVPIDYIAKYKSVRPLSSSQAWLLGVLHKLEIRNHKLDVRILPFDEGTWVCDLASLMFDVLGCGFPVSFEFPPLPGKPSSVCLATEFV